MQKYTCAEYWKHYMESHPGLDWQENRNNRRCGDPDRLKGQALPSHCFRQDHASAEIYRHRTRLQRGLPHSREEDNAHIYSKIAQSPDCPLQVAG